MPCIESKEDVTVCQEDEWADEQVFDVLSVKKTRKNLPDDWTVLCAGKGFECQAMYLALLG